MAAISQTTFSNIFPWLKVFVFWFDFPFKFVLKGPIDNKLALVQVMAGRRIGDKPLPEPMLIQITDAHMRHYIGGDELALNIMAKVDLYQTATKQKKARTECTILWA